MSTDTLRPLELDQHVVTDIVVLDGVTQPADIEVTLKSPSMSTTTVRLSDATGVLYAVELGRLYHFAWDASEVGTWEIDASFWDDTATEPTARTTWREVICEEVREGSC